MVYDSGVKSATEREPKTKCQVPQTTAQQTSFINVPMFETLSIKLEAICVVSECVVTKLVGLCFFCCCFLFVFSVSFDFGLCDQPNSQCRIGFCCCCCCCWLNAFFYLLSSFSFILRTQLDADVQCSDFYSMYTVRIALPHSLCLSFYLNHILTIAVFSVCVCPMCLSLFAGIGCRNVKSK